MFGIVSGLGELQVGVISMQIEQYETDKKPRHICIEVNCMHLSYLWWQCVFLVWAEKKSKRLFMWVVLWPPGQFEDICADSISYSLFFKAS